MGRTTGRPDFVVTRVTSSSMQGKGDFSRVQCFRGIGLGVRCQKLIHRTLRANMGCSWPIRLRKTWIEHRIVDQEV